MARVDVDRFDDRRVSRVFVAVSLAEARQAEAILNDHGVDYVISVEPCGTSLFGSPRSGAWFYVDVGQAEYCRSKLAAAGLDIGVVEDPPA
jgi:hypothetical protein